MNVEGPGNANTQPPSRLPATVPTVGAGRAHWAWAEPTGPWLHSQVGTEQPAQDHWVWPLYGSRTWSLVGHGQLRGDIRVSGEQGAGLTPTLGPCMLAEAEGRPQQGHDRTPAAAAAPSGPAVVWSLPAPLQGHSFSSSSSSSFSSQIMWELLRALPSACPPSTSTASWPWLWLPPRCSWL